MNETSARRWCALSLVVIATAVTSGVLCGRLAQTHGWSPCRCAPFVGLAVGVSVWALRWPSMREHVLGGALAALLGLTVFVWASHRPAWSVEASLSEHETDVLCIRITAMRLCYERKTMGVFDFNDVPQSIREEARCRVAAMHRDQKLEMCDATFASRINAGDVQSVAASGSVATGGLWLALAWAATLAPALARQWFRGHGPGEVASSHV